MIDESTKIFEEKNASPLQDSFSMIVNRVKDFAKLKQDRTRKETSISQLIMDELRKDHDAN